MIDNLVTGKKNLALAFRDGDEMNRLSKMAACDDYLLEALEEAVTIRYAFKELTHRYWKIRRLDKAKAERIKTYKMGDLTITELPGWFDGITPTQTQDVPSWMDKHVFKMRKMLLGLDGDGEQGEKT